MWGKRPIEDFHNRRSWLAWHTRYSGKPAGYTRKDGYVVINVFGVIMYAHRVIWALQTGAWPAGQVDHKDGRESRNEISNLRDVPRSINQRNLRRSRRNTSGVTGVSWCAYHGKWRAYINSDDGREELGLFVDFAEAKQVREAAEVRYGYTKRHGRAA